MQERDQTADQLLHANHLLKAVLDGIDDPIFAKDRQGRYLTLNVAACRVLGKPLESLIGKNDTELFSPETARVFMETDQRVMNGGETIVAEEIDAAVESTRVFLSTKTPYRDAQGRVIGLIGIARDITERQEAEVALRTSESRFKAVIENMPVMMVAFDTTGTLVVWNRECERLTGYRAEETIGNPQAMQWLCPDASKLEQNLQEWKEHEADYRDWEWSITCKDGTTKIISWSDISQKVPIPGWAAWGIGVDITERKRAVDQVVRSERELRLITNNVRATIAYVDSNYKYQFVNRRYAEWFGISQEEIVGKPVEAVLGTAMFESLRPKIDGVLSGKEARFEVLMPCSDGESRWLNATLVPTFDDEHNVAGFLVLTSDITSQKQAQEKLRSEERLLRKMLEIQERERKMVAHDIHDGFVQDVVAAHMQLEADRAKLKSGREISLESFSAISKHLQDAIAEARRLIRDLRPMIIDERGIVEAIKHLIAEADTQSVLQVAFTHQVQFDRLDPMLESAVFRIVQEALTNVKRHGQTDQAEVRLTQENGTVKIEVRDQGAGFDVAMVPSDRFGLRGIRERARLFGGHATIRSEPGQGTRVTAELPVVPLTRQPAQDDAE